MSASYYDTVSTELINPTNITELLYLIWCKLVYSNDITISKLPYMRCIPTIPNKFIKEKVSRTIEQEERTMMLQSFNINSFMIPDNNNYSVLYLDENPIGTGYVSDPKTFKKTLAGVFSVLSKYYPENSVARKYHPNFPGNKHMIDYGDILPDFMPAEFLYNENIELYFGFYSAALGNVTQGTVVSLIDMFIFRNNEVKEQLKDELIQGSLSEILFPCSMAEFENILIDMKNDKLK